MADTILLSIGLFLLTAIGISVLAVERRLTEIRDLLKRREGEAGQ